MGRKAIATRDAVYKAAASIEIQTGNPTAITIDAIRELIGGGSSSTIHAHLKQWRVDHVDGFPKNQNDEDKTFSLPPTIKSFIAKLRSDIDTLEKLLELEMTSRQGGLEHLQDAISTPPSDIPKATTQPKAYERTPAPKTPAEQEKVKEPKPTNILENKDSVAQEKIDKKENSEQSEVEKPKQDTTDKKGMQNKPQRKKQEKKKDASTQGDLFS